MALMLYPWQKDLTQELVHLKDAMPNAVLVYGPRGIGTFELVHAFAKSLLCTNPAQDGSPCGQCKGCTMVEAGTHPDIRYLVSEAEAVPRNIPYEPPENASSDRKTMSSEILIHQPRALANFLALKSHSGGLRVILVYPADRIRAEAAASLLKSIEEPPESTVFILVADDIDRVLPTIRSRCRLLRAAPPSRETALSWLKSVGVTNAEEALVAAGGMPLTAMDENDRLVLPESTVERLTELLLLGKQADFGDIASSVDKTVTLPALMRFLTRWAWDMAALKVGAPARYYPDSSSGLKALVASAEPAKLYAWINSVRDVTRVSEHPLSAKLIAEAILIAYRRIF